MTRQEEEDVEKVRKPSNRVFLWNKGKENTETFRPGKGMALTFSLEKKSKETGPEEGGEQSYVPTDSVTNHSPGVLTALAFFKLETASSFRVCKLSFMFSAFQSTKYKGSVGRKSEMYRRGNHWEE